MAEIVVQREQPTRKQWKFSRRIHGDVVSLSSGHELPRNSLDFTMMVRQKPPKGSSAHEKAPTAKNVMIHKDFPNQPSVIARLMGIDTMPIIVAKDATMMMIHGEQTISNLKLPIPMQIKATTPPPSRPAPFRHCLKKMRPRRNRSRLHHHHPQEELLDKIKVDFQAWQTSKAADHHNARNVAALGSSTSGGSNPLDGKYIQMLAQENLRKEKMAKYGYGGNIAIAGDHKAALKNGTESAAKVEKSEEKKTIKVLRVNSHCTETSEKFRDGSEISMDEDSHSTYAKSRSSPKRIVILKPGSEIGGNGNAQESFLSSSSKLKREGNMEVFLEEVKERLKRELKVKDTSEVFSSRSRSSSSWGSDHKQMAKQIIREAMTMQELGKRFSRSESFRAFRSDRKSNPSSVEHVALKNVIVSRTEAASSSSPIVRSRERVRSLTDASLTLTPSGFDEQSCTSEMVAGVVPSSPRALVRSLSAPAAAGRSLHGRSFWEDDVDAEVRSSSARHGNSDAVSEGAAMARRNLSGLRGTVSSLRHSFSSRANKLLGRRRKKHWSMDPLVGEALVAMAPSPPRSFSVFAVAQDNFTDLPPSPASPWEVKGHSSRHFFRDLSFALPAEVSPRSWSEFDSHGHRPSSESSSSCMKINTSTETDPDMAYIEQVLIAAGLLYDDGSSINKANSRVDSMAMPICDDIFDELEDDCCYFENKAANGGGDDDDDDEIAVLYSSTSRSDHRMLFDLANEALQLLVGSVPPAGGSSLRRWVVDSTGVSRGRKLVDDVWQQVQALRNPPMQQEMQTVDGMVAREARRSPWLGVLYEDAYVLGRKMERAIFDDLIDDVLQELLVPSDKM